VRAGGPPQAVVRSSMHAAHPFDVHRSICFARAYYIRLR